MSNHDLTDQEIIKLWNKHKKISQQKERILAQINRENDKKRKERAHRLIQKGALLEQYFEIKNLDVNETEQLLKMFSDFVISKKPDHLKK
ncbi:hypothetical protein COO16_04245 [Bacillus pseudomycoides]|uniref:hypothetical protein n=1 Tax=Bacillus pseudomycoides TaxID=64104 RepID=UPI000BEB4D4A|nr:hypothetical protein [Bacillus pseudomycoides]PDY14179.1 hypothetical protein COO16_04245 [Bacillus pseudomycoides]